MNPRRASIPGKSLRAAAALLGIWIAASSLHAQNTHSAQLIRAQQQYFTAADSPSLNFGSGSLTVKAWVKVNANAANTQDMVILEKRASGDAAYMLYLANGGALYAEAGEGSSGTAAQTVQIDDGVWHHVAMTYDQSTLRLFLDGVQRATKSVPGRDLSTTGQLAIGRSALSSASYFDGFIDEVRIWDVARTATQIQAEKNSKPVGTASSLRGYWSFDNTLADATPNANTLTAYGSPAFTTSTLPFTTPNNAFSVSGTITVPEGTTDPVYATLQRTGQSCSVLAAANRTFNFPLVIAADYTLSAFIDFNGNGARGTGEPVGDYAGNPLVISANVTGLSVTIPATQPVGSGLVGWWRLDETAGFNAADSSGYGHHGAVTNATFEQVDGRRALRFSGAGSYAQVPHHADLVPQSLTMVAWVRYTNDSARTTNSGLISKLNSYRLWPSFGVARGQVTGAGEIGAQAPEAAEWHHLAFTADATGRVLYRDGVPVASSTGAAVPTSTADLILGSAHTNEEFFNGHLADVRIYNRALSRNEILGLMAPATLSGTASYGGRITGRPLVQASAGAARFVVKPGSNGAFLFSEMLSGFAYAVSAFVDMNGNGTREAWEPFGEAAGNPITANGNVTGINISVTEA